MRITSILLPYSAKAQKLSPYVNEKNDNDIFFAGSDSNEKVVYIKYDTDTLGETFQIKSRTQYPLMISVNPNDGECQFVTKITRPSESIQETHKYVNADQISKGFKQDEGETLASIGIATADFVTRIQEIEKDAKKKLVYTKEEFKQHEKDNGEFKFASDYFEVPVTFGLGYFGDIGPSMSIKESQQNINNLLEREDIHLGLSIADELDTSSKKEAGGKESTTIGKIKRIMDDRKEFRIKNEESTFGTPVGYGEGKKALLKGVFVQFTGGANDNTSRTKSLFEILKCGTNEEKAAINGMAMLTQISCDPSTGYQNIRQFWTIKINDEQKIIPIQGLDLYGEKEKEEKGICSFSTSVDLNPSIINKNKPDIQKYKVDLNNILSKETTPKQKQIEIEKLFFELKQETDRQTDKNVEAFLKAMLGKNILESDTVTVTAIIDQENAGALRKFLANMIADVTLDQNPKKNIELSSAFKLAIKNIYKFSTDHPSTILPLLNTFTGGNFLFNYLTEENKQALLKYLKTNRYVIEPNKFIAPLTKALTHNPKPTPNLGKKTGRPSSPTTPYGLFKEGRNGERKISTETAHKSESKKRKGAPETADKSKRKKITGDRWENPPRRISPRTNRTCRKYQSVNAP